ncbi:hypothetical protein DEI92_09830 [Curtobacterium sp. MCBD17_034]|nr:hypothetical protein DEI92_09830 [Curtobacterium sp. MCBD17_034]PZM34183.1 hypothetical protein DEI90_08305 [Curtobacterium sp. MCBD17_031]
MPRPRPSRPPPNALSRRWRRPGATTSTASVVGCGDSSADRRARSSRGPGGVASVAPPPPSPLGEVPILLCRPLAVIAASAALSVVVIGTADPGAGPAASAATVVPASTAHHGARAGRDGLPPRGAEYVALGDSYAAGYGLPHATGDPVPACGQSSEDYPHRIAASLDLRLVDVTCAGATSADVVSRRQNGAAPQVDALSDRTRLVTLSIGGNDAGLFATASSCVALSRRGPVLSGADVPNCRSRLVTDGTDALAAAVEGPVTRGIRSAVRAVRTAAPHARLVVVGYPTIFPDAAHTPAAGCFRAALDAASLTGSFPRDAFPFTDTDVRYLHGVQQRLDRTTRAVVHQAGGTYVSMLSATAAHSPCSRTRPFVRGITLSASSGLRDVDLVPGALHPNAAGAGAMATDAGRRIRAVYAEAAARAREARASASAQARASASAAARAAAARSSADAGRLAIGAGVVVLGAVVVVWAFVRRRRRPDGS